MRGKRERKRVRGGKENREERINIGRDKGKEEKKKEEKGER